MWHCYRITTEQACGMCSSHWICLHSQNGTWTLIPAASLSASRPRRIHQSRTHSLHVGAGRCMSRGSKPGRGPGSGQAECNAARPLSPRRTAAKPTQVSISGIEQAAYKSQRNHPSFINQSEFHCGKHFLTWEKVSDERRMKDHPKSTSVVAGLAVLLCALVLPSVNALSLYPYPGPGICGSNEVYQSCGGCEGTCTNPNPICTLQCRAPQCVCRTGYVRHHGQCVLEKSCPTFCGENEVFRSCGACEGTCDNPNPICTLECRPPRCVCRSGYVRQNGRCVSVKSCPVYEPGKKKEERERPSLAWESCLERERERERELYLRKKERKKGKVREREETER